MTDCSNLSLSTAGLLIQVSLLYYLLTLRIPITARFAVCNQENQPDANLSSSSKLVFQKS